MCVINTAFITVAVIIIIPMLAYGVTCFIMGCPKGGF